MSEHKCIIRGCRVSAVETGSGTNRQLCVTHQLAWRQSAEIRRHVRHPQRTHWEDFVRRMGFEDTALTQEERNRYVEQTVEPKFKP
jgi:hypothetical protein